nr:ribonuclease H-like domain-containing protein [Tanacetum cinerariifolium]
PFGELLLKKNTFSARSHTLFSYYGFSKSICGLWEVILNGDSPVPTRLVEDKHQLKFNSHKDAKSLMEAIEKRFGGNTETKKVQKTLLKQQFKNFSGSTSESLDQIHDRLQKLADSTNDSVSAAVSVSAVAEEEPTNFALMAFSSSSSNSSSDCEVLMIGVIKLKRNLPTLH